MASLDPRIHPSRTDIAAQYARRITLHLKKGVSALRKSPSATAEQVSELRYGDSFTVYETKDGWHWGQCGRDGYMGYAQDDGFIETPFTPTHRINTLKSFVFPEGSSSAPPIDALSFFSAVEVVNTGEKFFELKTGGFVHKRHLTPIADWRERDIVFTAGRMIGVPYLWGGSTPAGLDCSGLVQLALEAAGIDCPRDSDMQAASVGVLIDDLSRLHRGDIVYFPGHVGIMADQTALLHANSYHGCVVVEPLADVIARGSEVLCARRI